MKVDEKRRGALHFCRRFKIRPINPRFGGVRVCEKETMEIKVGKVQSGTVTPDTFKTVVCFAFVY
jgi:hypothetical protein